MSSRLQLVQEEHEQGFTLIELLVVILIIGILSAIAIPAFLNQRKSAVDSSVQSDLSNASKQVETWIVKQGATKTPLPATPETDLSIKKSDGTALAFFGNSHKYCITGTNPGGDVSLAANGGFVYVNDNGGLKTGSSLTTTAVCNSTNYPS